MKKKRLPSVWNWKRPITSIKWAFQRIKYGCCDMDAWNIDYFLETVIPDLLYKLEANHVGYPGREPYDTPEKWETALGKAASELLTSSRWEEYPNPYREEFMKYLMTPWIKREDGSWEPEVEVPDGLREMYRRQEEANHKTAVHMRNRALDWIRDNWENLWD